MRSKASTRHERGFSLVEILIVLALITVIGGLFVTNLDSIFDGLGDPPPPELLHKAVREARFEAASTKGTVYLSYDSESGKYKLSGQDGESIAELNSGLDTEYSSDQIEFFQILPEKGLSSLNAGDGERVRIASVRFNPDRSSTPFVAKMEYDDIRSEHRYDPFSDLEISDEK